jgi:superfamily II DNA/RNA helicase
MEDDILPELNDDEGNAGDLAKKKVQLTLGTWFFDKRAKRKKYISLAGKVYAGTEAVKRSRHEKYSQNHPCQLARHEFLYSMQSLHLATILFHFQTNKNSLLLLENWGLPANILRRYSQHKISKLFPWQVDCLLVDNGVVFQGTKNLIYSAPTSGGKTLVSELLILKKLSTTMTLGDPKSNPRKTIFFIVPFIALAEEKSTYFREIWSDMNIGIKTFHNEDGTSNILGEDVELVICTIERANILINQLFDDKRENQLSMIIIDEIHLLSDSNRGFLLEVLLTKVLYVCKEKVQIVGMSATLPNIAELADWLSASLYITEYRPVNLDILIAKESNIYRAKKLEDIIPTNNNQMMIVENEEEGSHSNDSCQSVQQLFRDTNLNQGTTQNNHNSFPGGATSLFQAVQSVASSSSSTHFPNSFNNNHSVSSAPPKTTTTVLPIKLAPGFIVNPPYEQYLPPPPPLTLQAPQTLPPQPVVLPEKKETVHYEFISTIPKLKDDQDGFKSLCLDTIQKEKSVLVFCNSKRRCEVCAQAITQTIRENASTLFMLSSFSSASSSHQRNNNNNHSNNPFNPSSSLFQNKYQQLQQQRFLLLQELDQTFVGLCPVLKECMPFGVAYHHAGLTNDERNLVEKGFRTGCIQVLCTTSTLSAGVNLPAHRVIIR